jgi:lipopolysaccharide export system protein LptC
LKDVELIQKNYLSYLKYILPTFSVGLILSVFFFSSRIPSAQTPARGEISVNTAKNIRYSGQDEKGHPFMITSIKGQEISETHILLHELEAILDLTGDAKIKLRADQGLYDKTTKTIHISGGVKLNHSNGLELITSKATINFEEGTAENNVPVEGNNERATIKAQGFRVLEQGQKVVFLGQPELVIHTHR